MENQIDDRVYKRRSLFSSMKNALPSSPPETPFADLEVSGFSHYFLA